ncbi:EPIDERMAL PATTERNING FACTOR-like protein 4 [Euphorbia lathyris]|uniref:EPIDERMAL PATTERNING FACTOR-like protein 4 n=1 Tax=Euphorbia lathyris TaxID=212925 RepID=UPI0033137F69
MAVLRLRHHLSAVTAFTFLLFFSSSGLVLSHLLGTEFTKTEQGGKVAGLTAFDRFKFFSQKRLGGPGSSPPTCRSKCGRCSPCKPVHVPIQPGLSMPLEYYPEAWRCKCANKLFMP